MIETDLSPIHSLPSGLCEDPTREVTTLIERMANSDAAALVELHGMWSPVLLGVAYRMLGDRREADEVVQDTFVRLWRNSEQYDPHQAPPFVWAFTVMRGYCIDRLRARHRTKKESAGDVPIHLPTLPGKSENLRVMSSDDFRRVRSALDQLTPDECGCLELAVFLGYSHPESHEHPGSPVGTLKNRLRQALKKVRNHLSRYEL